MAIDLKIFVFIIYASEYKRQNNRTAEMLVALVL